MERPPLINANFNDSLLKTGGRVIVCFSSSPAAVAAAAAVGAAGGGGGSEERWRGGKKKKVKACQDLWQQLTYEAELLGAVTSD